MLNNFQMGKVVRGILTRMRLDTQHVTVNFDHGRLIIGGRFEYLYGTDGHRPTLSFEVLHEIDRQLRRVEDVKELDYILENWTHNSDGHWTRKQERDRSGPARSMQQRLRAQGKPV